MTAWVWLYATGPWHRKGRVTDYHLGLACECVRVYQEHWHQQSLDISLDISLQLTVLTWST